MANKKALELDQLKTSLSAVKNWTSGEITNATKNKANKDTVLLKDNVTEYTPTADYNPSTKKYVDDKITEVDKTFTGATSSTNGANGLVPAPTKGNQSKYLKADGTWGTPYTHPTTAGNKHIPAGGASGNVLKWSANGTAVWGDPDSTKYYDFVGATSDSDGQAGLVPASIQGDQNKFLKADGTWSDSHYCIDISQADDFETIVSNNFITRLYCSKITFNNVDDDAGFNNDPMEYIKYLYEKYNYGLKAKINTFSNILNIVNIEKTDTYFSIRFSNYDSIELAHSNAPSSLDTAYRQHEYISLYLVCTKNSYECYYYVDEINYNNVVTQQKNTLTEKIIAQSNTAYTTYQVRNIAFSTSASVPTGNGSILGVYS